MDIEQIEKIKELKDKGILTQEEFDAQIAIALSSTDKDDTKQEYQNIEEDDDLADDLDDESDIAKPLNIYLKNLTIKHLIYICVAVVGVYIGVETIFPKVVPCTDSISEQKCNCVKQSLARSVSFLNKVKVLIMGASQEELFSYATLDVFRCVFTED